MDTQNDKQVNLEFAGHIIQDAAKAGASLVAFPETMNYMGRGYRHQAETLSGETMSFLREKAQEYHVWILSGSIPEIHVCGKPKNTLALIDPSGNIRCCYSKLHMFDIQLSDGPSFMESRDNTAGDEIVIADTALGRMGFSICYDIRFGEIYRLMALNGAQIIFVPASFTAKTGEAHWEVLLRARAIENGVYIIAPAQIGHKTTSDTYGHAMAVDPWGRVIALMDDQPGYVMADIDLDYVEAIRSQIPSLKNRRQDIYQLRSDHIVIR